MSELQKIIRYCSECHAVSTIEASKSAHYFSCSKGWGDIKPQYKLVENQEMAGSTEREIMNFIKHSVIEIIWMDSKGVTSEWEYKDELKDMLPCQCKSTGYLEIETDTYVTIYQSEEDTQVLGRMTIPKCSILSITAYKRTV